MLRRDQIVGLFFKYRGDCGLNSTTLCHNPAIRKAEVEESFFKVRKINLTPKNFDNQSIKRNRLCSNVLKLEAIKEIKRTVASVEGTFGHQDLHGPKDNFMLGIPQSLLFSRSTK
ncbi:hypothetical protein WN51_06322 [Melipona quadrifasciata]|uniref:Uncharacterized protein n=1 Tax=Melipona quadrifasciata TaxID=166423 RepID=A0A0M8ZTF0_9HYME|nr:hypothetical protein WN51_06322 [Melipona quadrifasciata]